MNSVIDDDDDRKIEAIVLGGGCFWCTEAVFKMLKGVISVEPGYAGGHAESPVYEEVCTGETGHAEVVRIKYDSDIISLKDILDVFFSTHDPTTKNRQGQDIGEQYRSIILWTTKDQKIKIKKFISEISRSYPREKSIVTEVFQLNVFFPAELHHRNYCLKHPEGYCQNVAAPKLKKLEEKFKHLLK